MPGRRFLRALGPIAILLISLTATARGETLAMLAPMSTTGLHLCRARWQLTLMRASRA